MNDVKRNWMRSCWAPSNACRFAASTLALPEWTHRVSLRLSPLTDTKYRVKYVSLIFISDMSSY